MAQQIRQVDPAIATVLITGFDLAEDDRRLAAFDLWYEKPLSVEQLDEMLISYRSSIETVILYRPC